MCSSGIFPSSEERYRTLFDCMTEGFALHKIITDGQGRPCDYRFLEVNPAFEQLSGLKHGDLLGKRVREAKPATEEHWIDSCGRVALKGESLHMENYSAALERWYEVVAYSPAPMRFTVVFADITARKRAEELLRERERCVFNKPHRLFSTGCSQEESNQVWRALSMDDDERRFEITTAQCFTPKG
jgi:PAS domain S-box-containing protein